MACAPPNRQISSTPARWAAAITVGLISPCGVGVTMTRRSTPATLAGMAFISTDDRIGRPPARHIDACRINRTPSRTQANASLIGIVAVLGQLRLVIGFDPSCREFQRIAQFGVERLIGSGAFLCRNLPALLAQIKTVEAFGELAQRHIAARTNIADGGFDDARHIGIGLTPRIDQRLKLCVRNRAAMSKA